MSKEQINELYWEGLTSGQIAIKLGIPLKDVKKALLHSVRDPWHTLNIKMSKQMLDDLEVAARKQERTRAEQIREILRQYLQSQSEGQCTNDPSV